MRSARLSRRGDGGTPDLGDDRPADDRPSRDRPAEDRALTRRLLLVRHGRTEWNADGRFQGQLDPPLDDVGLGQAAAVAEALADVRPASVVTSDLRRAADTAAAIGERCGLPVRYDPRLREIDLGAWQGLTREQAAAAFPAEYEAWVGGLDVARGGGETYAQVAERAAAAVLEVLGRAAASATVVAVTHGGTARAMTGRLLDLPQTAWWRLAPLGNCRWAVLLETRRGWRLAEHNVAAAAAQVTAGDDR